ncbi:THUMP-like domain-containing protein [Echinicola shivajiensis]|uniref:THUMP-like domain-containing protein n=1 Tax=Echinicola shivajiensis TaxID=1035916 RepID=UPI00293D21A2|nr:class I SAM-dependent methyltransferase [Echinicola shivajiensis]
MQDHLDEDPAQLLLKHHQIQDLDIKEAVQQISARKKAQHKLPSWVANLHVIFPASISLEQCSSEQTANFKARLVKGQSLVDLTGGFGVDTYFLGQQFEKVVYLERQEKLAEIAALNFSRLSDRPEKFQVLSKDSIEFLSNTDRFFDWIYVDPARRGDHNQKLYKLADCEPDIVSNWAMMIEKADNIMVKASPMLDIKEALKELLAVQVVHVIAVKNEVKEILLIWRKELKDDEPLIKAWNLSDSEESAFEFTYAEEEQVPVFFSPVEKYLIMPSAAILKAGGFKSFAHQYELKKLHPNTHLYTADQLPENIQGRAFEVLEEIKLGKKKIKQLFPSGKVNVLSRNHPLKAEAIKRKFKLKDGGQEFLLACTTSDGQPKAFSCRRVV